MGMNSLTRKAGVKIGPLILETLVKHYLERIASEHGAGSTQLRKDELLYDEAFNIVKTFLEASTKHTIEELQEFSNTRTPSPPWTHVVRLLVPVSCCDEAAALLIRAFGGEQRTKETVGGTKWWQVRGLRGIDAEWITAKKDHQEQKKRFKAREKGRASQMRSDTAASEAGPSAAAADAAAEEPTYEPEMDEMRCILFAHGGGYYFGSVDQERYSIERYARKIRGRVFAINYRLAPQYPFPCAIQDMLAAYLYLIRPPPGALHRPVNPAHIVVAGDSAGGGLCIALLQLIRDTGLPAPAGGVLISPWCDLTHTFPSIHTNTATDVLPRYGLSFHKPSTLWPPPPEEYSSEMDSLRTRFIRAVHPSRHPSHATRPSPVPTEPLHDHTVPTASGSLHLGSAAELPHAPAGARERAIRFQTAEGERVIEQQVQMYCTNDLLTHPLVSSVLSYVGGLPPLLIIASEKEVLRDEIIYFAHRARYPERFPLKDEIRKMYPPLEGIEQRYEPTQVHLQVYDDAAHVLPVLFSFTTPAKYCYRAIATFCKYVTGLPLPTSPILDIDEHGSPELVDSPLTESPPSSPFSLNPPLSPMGILVESPEDASPASDAAVRSLNMRGSHSAPTTPRTASQFSADVQDTANLGVDTGTSRSKRSLRRLSANVRNATSFLNFAAHSQDKVDNKESGSGSKRSDSADVAGPRFYGKTTSYHDDALRRAGEASVYANGLDTMIRERVSTTGIIRSLEPESELPAMQVPEELVGTMSELVMRRYFEARDKFDRKFKKTGKAIEKARRRNFEAAKHDALRNLTHLQNFLQQDEDAVEKGRKPKKQEGDRHGIKDGLMSAGSWPWAWALDLDEQAPPSSIVARRDTEEARRLAKVADQAVLSSDNALSGNNLWSLIVDFLTVDPQGTKGKDHGKHNSGPAEMERAASSRSSEERHRSRFAWFEKMQRKAQGNAVAAPKDS